MPGRQGRRIVDALLLGVIGALSAQVFMMLLGGAQTVFLTWIAGYRPPGLPEEGGILQQAIGPHGLWLIPLVTTIGGLLAGVLVYSLAPEAEGHGTDAAVRAFHCAGGVLRGRVPPLKMLASAITIGSGGAAGREGPIALITAGIGSVYATARRRSEDERRLLVLTGMAAGLAAIFRSPIGAALFAIEVLYSDMEFEASALLYAMLAAVVAYAFNGLVVGWQPLFHVPALSAPTFPEYGWYVVLGATSGVVASLLPMVFYGIRDAFRAIPLPAHVKPAIGALGIGVLALSLPQVLGGGYGWIQEAIDGRLGLVLLLSLLFAKMLALALTVASGGSGGVFAPSLFVGAMLGGSLAQLVHQPPAAFVIVGMAAVFAGAARVPIATLLMVTEMTGGYRLLVPAALAVMLSYLAQSMLSAPLKYRSLYEAQVPGRADSPAHRVEHLQTALRLLRERRVSTPATIGHLDLQALLESGVAVDLPDNEQLAIGVLQASSPWVGTPFHEGAGQEETNDVQIVAVIRQGRMLFPNATTVLRAGDRALVITPQQSWERLTPHLAPFSST
jgi:CIC family chloride channel protein